MNRAILYLLVILNSFEARIFPQESLIATRLAEIRRNPTSAIGENMVLLPGGWFRMGSNDEGLPVHKTYVGPFWISKYEVTQAEWKAVMEYNPSQFQDDPYMPVTNITVDNCQEFIKKLNALVGNNLYRLPSEEEWEYACRAGSSTEFYFGNSPDQLQSYGWNGVDKPRPVGKLLPNAWGLYDMHGNVSELCVNYLFQSSNEQPGIEIVSRGGDYQYAPMYCESAARSTEVTLYGVIGFRLARALIPEEESLAHDAAVREATAARSRLLKRIDDNMVYITGGSFFMGSNTGNDNEKPVHKVTVSPFMINKYEVTQEEKEIIMGEGPQEDSWYADHNLPAKFSSLHAVKEFINKLNEISGKKEYRMPTEAEWEYACRAGTTTEYFFGDWENPLKEYAWFSKNCYFSNSEATGYRVKSVGKLKPNPWGLYDIYGNILELCQDYFGEYRSGAVTNPKGPLTGSLYVARGGSYIQREFGCRSTMRYAIDPTKWYEQWPGLRIVKLVERKSIKSKPKK